MVYFVIAGKDNCAHFMHATHAARHLSNCLPHFSFKDIEVPRREWTTWLDTLNTKYKWDLNYSPVVWKEISRMGGKPYLIGSLSEFWEYCYDYYGFQSFHEYANIKAIQTEREYIAEKKGILPPQVKIYTMIGSWRRDVMLSLMIYEIHNMTEMRDCDSILFRLYDPIDQEAEDQEAFLRSMEELKTTLTQGKLKICTSLIQAVKKADMIFVFKNYQRLPDETLKSWLGRCYNDMFLLAHEVNFYAPRRLKIILCHPGPVCFTASVLVKYVTSIRLANIVAVTADEGLSAITCLSNETGVQIEEISCPPVWGFSGINSFIDIGRAFLKGEVYRPFNRALKATETTKLPKGKIVAELRLMSSVIDDEERVQYQIAHTKAKLLKKNKYPFYGKIRALCSLLKLWQTGEPLDDIISLGICSNGSFGFPHGIVFSQTVILNEKRFWEPFTNFPISSNSKNRILEILLELADIFKSYGLGTD